MRSLVGVHEVLEFFRRRSYVRNWVPDARDGGGERASQRAAIPIIDLPHICRLSPSFYRVNETAAFMPTYLVKVTYTDDGARSVLEEGASSRREKLKDYTEKMGGTLRALYYSTGEYDAYAIVDFPDKTAMAAASMLTKASGGGTCSATQLLSPEEMDEATSKAEIFD